MPFPKTIAELISSGYKFENHASCRGCQAVIEWWLTPRGKKMPLDVNERTGFIKPHWETCPKADMFRVSAA